MNNLRIERRSNQTRADQRPPLFISLAASALFSELQRRYPRRDDIKTARLAKKDPEQAKPVPPAVEAKRPMAAPRGYSFHPPQNGRPANNGANGSNGHSVQSQSFRSSSFTSTPTMRQSSAPSVPVQIPLENDMPFKNRQAPEPQVKPAGPPDRNQAENNAPDSPPVDENASLPRFTPPARPVQPVPRRKTIPGMADFLQQHTELPAQTALLGVCEDGLPVLLDLFDPAPGAVISIGDEREKQLDLLHSAIASMTARNSPRSVQFIVLTCDSKGWREWIAQQGIERYCLAVEDADSELVREWVLRLADWTEQRRMGQRSGPPVLLVMDTLSFLPRLSYDVRLNFEWMIREGPQAQVWPLAAISTELAKLLHSRRMLRAFHTRILGYTNNPAVYVDLAGLSQELTSVFSEAGQFAVQVGESWLHFRLFGSQ